MVSKVSFYRLGHFEPVGSGTTKFYLGPDFCPQKDETLNFHLQQLISIYLDPGRIF